MPGPRGSKRQITGECLKVRLGPEVHKRGHGREDYLARDGFGSVFVTIWQEMAIRVVNTHTILICKGNQAPQNVNQDMNPILPPLLTTPVIKQVVN
jgi:hypothetical protein